MQLQTFKDEFDSIFQDHIAQKITELKTLYSESLFDELLKYLHEYVQEWKRFRPYLVYLLYMACWGKDLKYIMKVWICFEFLHVFALIHDDICDKGTIRHSRDTYHIWLGKKLWSEDEGINQAILVGDLILFRVQHDFYEIVSDPHAKKQFGANLQELVYGQMIDVYFSGTKTMFSLEDISLKDKLKSWRYSFMRPMCIGAALAGNEDIKEIELLGDLLGEAFQLRDDLIDILDTHSNKTPFSDITEGNQTRLFSYAYTHASPQQKTYLEEARHRHLSDTEKEELKRIYTDTWAIAYTIETLTSLLQTAKTKVETIAWADKSYQVHLFEIITLLTKW